MPEQLPPLPDAEQLFEELPCGLVITSHTGTILRVNRTFCQWTGVASADLVGKRSLSELFTMGGRIFHQTHWVPMLQLQGSLSEVKLDVRHQGGPPIPMMLNAVRRHTPEGGGYDEIVFTVANERNKYERELVLARKRSDELAEKERQAQATLQVLQSRVRQALNGGSLFIWGVDAATGRRTYGEEVALLLGHRVPGVVSEEAVLAGLSPDERDAERAALTQALRIGGPSYSWKFALRGVDGRRRIVVASGQSFFKEDGSLEQFVGILQDVTASETLREAAEDRALFAEQMVGIVSHDLRNPLSAILIGVQMLAGAIPLGVDQRAALTESVSRSARRAQRLTAELLDFTAARVGRGIAVVRQAIDLHGFVGQIIDDLRLSFPGRLLIHDRFGSGDCSAAPDRLAQLVGNLVGNAVAYGAADAAVTITSSLEGEIAEIAVRNLGSVIPPELIDDLFEPMVRGGDLDSSVRSVGLGLFIVRAIARAHQGEVKVTSNAEEGTTFRFRFPRS